MIDHDADRYVDLVDTENRVFLTLYGASGERHWYIFDADDKYMARPIAHEIVNDHLELEEQQMLMCYVIDVTEGFENWVNTGSFSAALDEEISRKWRTLELSLEDAAYLHPTLQGELFGKI